VEVTAGGADAWNNVDQFTYLYTQVTGDFDVRVQVDSMLRIDNWTKPG